MTFKHNVKNINRMTGLSLLVLLSISGYGYANASAPQGDVVLPTQVVTANRITQPLEHANSDVSVVTRKQIETMHMNNVEDALRITPGVQFLNYGPNGLDANLSGIRINGSKNIVVAVDGHRLSAFEDPASTGYMYASMLNNMEGIERIEVLRGAQSTQYGSGAQGGVVNIVTRKITKDQTTLTSSGGTSSNKFAFSTMGKRGQFRYFAYANQSITGDMKDGSGMLWPGHSDITSKGIKLLYSKGKHDLSTEVETLGSHFNGKDYLYSNFYTGHYRYHRYTIQDTYNANKHLRNELMYRFNDVNTEYWQVYYDGTADWHPTSHFKYHFLTDTVHFNDSRNNGVAGIEYSYAKTGDIRKINSVGYKQIGDDGQPYDPDDIWGHYKIEYTYAYRTMKNMSYFLYDEWKFAPKLTFAGGVRYDDTKGDQYSPDFGSHVSKSYKLIYQATPKDSIYAGKGDFYVLPSMMQEFDPENGNDQLLPAYGNTKTIGLTHIFSPKSFLTFNWFNTYTARTIGFGTKNTYKNYSGGVARGWNVQYTTQLNPAWFVQVGMAHLFQYDPGSPNFSYGYYPKDLATFNIMYKKNKWNVGVDGFYFVRKLNPNYTEKGWPHTKFGVYNLSVNYKAWKHAEVFMTVNNIFNTLWAEHTKVIWGGKPGQWYAQPGRTFTFGIKAQF